MGLDILLFRDPDTAAAVRESERRRYAKPEVVDEIIAMDQNWRRTQFLSEATKKMINTCSKAVGEKKKSKEADGDVSEVPAELLAAAHEGNLDADKVKGLCILQLKELSKALAAQVTELAKAAAEQEQERDRLVVSVGNVLHESVPVSNDEDTGNVTVRTFGDVTRRMKLTHVDCMEKLGLMDTSKTVTAMAGGRAFVLRGGLVQLQFALISYAMNFLVSRNYEPFYPPFFLNKDYMSAVSQLSDFDESLYKVSGDGDEKYLIATSEAPIAAYHSNKWFTELKEPLRYAGVSTCFRKEAGAHGRDTLGIFRVHQFDKIEQFVVCSPREDESWKMLEELIKTSQDFNESLGLPYRVINICSGALNNAAAKKYDLEAWFPGSGAFRELVSCSNCTDFQSRGVNCRFGPNTKGTSANNTKEYCHMLNGTLCAVTRTMCCICENYQTEEGIVIPEVLRPFMMGTEMLKFPAEAAKTESA
ncbi:putative mitochondrial seryl-tRNA synthetase [Leptomonas pyrrhocoris]|uniref:serine--tRNA ligase n=1 Tax=Leptomonas pyrrhocoris TaxID=157538 RepID=A0A0N0VDY0_LEPPY|nr:putative mitochondrial seryl-tRNA synthetase [Leptomonas pyrrhocoris]XP_015655334.1 putative mitochondrial seryl-tRNA synthetase [Leptomonas pyrrhocoris]XP_015655335.1 putative mitochondrial seryl-tRNA synthetase [Leptomonas pyrrhocoris]KPA76894.1 putative mitochondrial seryl-tRNA synthetase [Leptomonas pyrrhocoris]KPA76895.1 putative mitochondrial seryl-tRNA synthetase [Leptomonas pyrrhocoris]KPA76896.1 putative mitochondrial seryl-tRNA synthetase [Leptomonas pyrrhocoris]|eukprot:XP_015655333.1 putative mitochondrial seryl-tRNA synthetase [Leptomonas pyrrhocoris]